LVDSPGALSLASTDGLIDASDLRPSKRSRLYGLASPIAVSCRILLVTQDLNLHGVIEEEAILGTAGEQATRDLALVEPSNLEI
jgi:hypothetical protein